jgi:hypothetical protein
MVNGKWFVVGCVAANVEWLMLGNPILPFYRTRSNVITIYNSPLMEVNGKWFVVGCVAANDGWLTLGDPTRPCHSTRPNVLTIYHLPFTINYSPPGITPRNVLR